MASLGSSVLDMVSCFGVAAIGFATLVVGFLECCRVASRGFCWLDLEFCVSTSGVATLGAGLPASCRIASQNSCSEYGILFRRRFSRMLSYGAPSLVFALFWIMCRRWAVRHRGARRCVAGNLYGFRMLVFACSISCFSVASFDVVFFQNPHVRLFGLLFQRPDDRRCDARRRFSYVVSCVVSRLVL
jgi:hypothetical protein